MPKLPVLSGREAVAALKRFGWEISRRRGSHVILVRDGSDNTLSVPDHKELDRGTLRSIIREAGVSVDEFLSRLK